MKKIKHEIFLKILEEIGAEYKGLTKSNEPIVEYKGKIITIGRKKKFNGEGYKDEAIKKIIQFVALEKSKEEGKSPGEIQHMLQQKIKQIVGYDF